MHGRIVDVQRDHVSLGVLPGRRVSVGELDGRVWGRWCGVCELRGWPDVLGGLVRRELDVQLDHLPFGLLRGQRVPGGHLDERVWHGWRDLLELLEQPDMHGADLRDASDVQRDDLPLGLLRGQRVSGGHVGERVRHRRRDVLELLEQPDVQRAAVRVRLQRVDVPQRVLSERSVLVGHHRCGVRQRGRDVRLVLERAGVQRHAVRGDLQRDDLPQRVLLG